MPKAKPKLIQSSLLSLGRTYKGKGKTIEEAVASIKPETIQSWGVLTLKKGQVSKERIIVAPNLVRAYGRVSPFTKEVGLKQIASLFDKKTFE